MWQFILGLFVGASIGIFIHCLLIASQRRMEKALLEQWQMVAEAGRDDFKRLARYESVKEKR